MALPTAVRGLARGRWNAAAPACTSWTKARPRTWTRRRQKLATFEQTLAAIKRADRWMLAMQNDDGGWGAFDRDNNRQFLCHVPFADHNAMIDPSTPDLTGRVLESLGRLGRRWAIRRSIARSPTSARRRRPTAVGSAAGA